VQQTSLAERQARTVTIEFPKPKPAALVTEPPPPPPPPARENGAARYLFFSGSGLALTGVAVGTVTGVMSMKAADDAKSLCKDNQCPPSAHADLERARTTGTISTIAFVAGGAGLGAAIVGLVMGPFAKTDESPVRPDARTDAKVRPWLGGTSAGLYGSF
jgi:hypothetical protein